MVHLWVDFSTHLDFQNAATKSVPVLAGSDLARNNDSVLLEDFSAKKIRKTTLIDLVPNYNPYMVTELYKQSLNISANDVAYILTVPDWRKYEKLLVIQMKQNGVSMQEVWTRPIKDLANSSITNNGHTTITQSSPQYAAFIARVRRDDDFRFGFYLTALSVSNYKNLLGYYNEDQNDDLTKFIIYGIGQPNSTYKLNG